MKKKLYAVTCDCEGYVAVVANSSKGAMRMGRGWLQGEHMCDCEFTDFRCKWNKDLDVSKLDDMGIGVVEDWVLGLKKGIYGYIEGVDCPECNEGDCTLVLINDKPMCYSCEEKESDAYVATGEGVEE